MFSSRNILIGEEQSKMSPVVTEIGPQMLSKYLHGI